MGPGTLEAKFIPLSKVECVEYIYIFRENVGPEIDKVTYLPYPKLLLKYRFLKILTPFLLSFHARKVKADLILGYHIIPHAFYTFIASKITGIPFVSAQTGLDIQKFSVGNRLFRRMLKMIFNSNAWLNVPGTSSLKYWSTIGVKSENIELLHSTINTELYIDYQTEKDIDFLFLGRLDPVKCIDSIIEGFSIYKNQYKGEFRSKFVIVGDGPDSQVLKDYVIKLNLSKDIVFTGFTPNPIEYINSSNFFVMSSVSEGLPTAMMQAMSCKVIPITNLVGNIGDIVKDKQTGFVHNGTPTAIAIAMQKAIELSDIKRNEIGVAARKSISEKHSYFYAIKKWNELLNNLRNE